MTPSYQLLDPISCKLKANPLYYKEKLLGRKNLKTKHADATMNQSENEVVKVASKVLIFLPITLRHFDSPYI